MITVLSLGFAALLVYTVIMTLTLFYWLGKHKPTDTKDMDTMFFAAWFWPFSIPIYFAMRFGFWLAGSRWDDEP